MESAFRFLPTYSLALTAFASSSLGFFPAPRTPDPDITFIHTTVTPQHRIDVPKRTASCKLFIRQAQAAHARRRSSPAPPAKRTA
jgi:hypothetical protein